MEEVHGSITALQTATIAAGDVTEKGIIARARLRDGTELLLHWEIMPDDARNASAFFGEYAEALEREADAELRELQGW